LIAIDVYGESRKHRSVLKEVLTLGLEEFEGSTDGLPRFIGGQQIEVTV
jgi:hypothetical protein